MNHIRTLLLTLAVMALAPACGDGNTGGSADGSHVDTTDLATQQPPDLTSPPPSCNDGLKNQNETDIDCGGVCAACATGKSCSVDKDCSLMLCRNATCALPSCMDSVKNQDETDVDCGGVCPACATGKACGADKDCATTLCRGALCVEASCMDTVKNQDETDVDCGGTKCAACATGKVCAADRDCATTLCRGALCVVASCMDTVKNQDETDVDCGGTKCAACATGKVCAADKDCATMLCRNALCVAPSCMDTVKNQDETDIDCGGTKCATCALGKACLKDTDCASKACAANKCVVAPALTSVAPICGPLAGGTTVTLNGTNYPVPSTPAVLFGATAAPLQKANDATTIVVTSPAAATAGKVNVTVNGLAGGTLSLPQSFRYVDPLPATLTFAAETSVGFSPSGVLAVGDFSGDGRADYIQEHSANHLDLAIGLAGGGFTNVTSLTVAGVTKRMIGADTNNDNKVDVLGTIVTNVLSVYTSSGTTLMTHKDYATNVGPEGLVAVNLNNDAFIDVAVIHSGADVVSVFINNGDGTYKAKVDYTVPRGVAIVSGDFDGDGKQDLATSAAAVSAVHVLLGNGDGTLKAAVAYPLLASSYALVTGDFNGDGKTDIVAANADRVSFLASLGAGGFAAALNTSIPMLANPTVLRAADLDGNGTLDLVLLNNAAARAEIWLNTCLGAFVSANKTFAVTGATDLWLGDFNADGKQDLIHASANGVRIISRM